MKTPSERVEAEIRIHDNDGFDFVHAEFARTLAAELTEAQARSGELCDVLCDFCDQPALIVMSKDNPDGEISKIRQKAISLLVPHE